MYSIAIIAAMDEEMEIILSDYLERKEEPIKIAGCLFFVGYINDKRVIVAKSGIGKVNAAICAQLLITKFDVKCIINTGTAGGISSDLKIGDVVLGSEYVYSDVDCTCFDYKYGQVPRMPHIYSSSSKLLNIATSLHQKFTSDYNFHIGRIASGDSFLVDKEVKLNIVDKTQSICMDMESTSFAQVCHLNNVNFMAIRCISDVANENAAIDFKTFVRSVSVNSAKFVVEIVKNLS